MLSGVSDRMSLLVRNARRRGQDEGTMATSIETLVGSARIALGMA